MELYQVDTLSQGAMIGQASSAGYCLWSGYWIGEESYKVYLPIVLRNRP